MLNRSSEDFDSSQDQLSGFVTFCKLCQTDELCVYVSLKVGPYSEVYTIFLKAFCKLNK